MNSHAVTSWTFAGLHVDSSRDIMILIVALCECFASYITSLVVRFETSFRSSYLKLVKKVVSFEITVNEVIGEGT